MIRTFVQLVFALMLLTAVAAQPAPSELDGCFENVYYAPLECSGDIVSDTYAGGCRSVLCEQDDSSLQVSACDKPTEADAQFFEMYRQVANGEQNVEICLDGACLNNLDFKGFDRSEDYPICELPPPVECEDCQEEYELVATKTYGPSAWDDAILDTCDPQTFLIPASIDVTQGNAGNHWALLSFDSTTCVYRGGSSNSHPATPEQIELGLRWNFLGCFEDYNGALPPNQNATGHEAGDPFTTDLVELKVNGDSYLQVTEGTLTLENQDSCIVPTEPLLLTSMCTYEEDGARWRVRNANAFDVPFTWEVYPNLENGSGIALANSDTFFDSSLTGTMKIYWEDELGEARSTVKATNPALCEPDPVECAQSVRQVSVECEGGAITYDEPFTSPTGLETNCRHVVCEDDGDSLHVMACDQPNEIVPEYFEMYRQEMIGDGIEICLDGVCLNNFDMRGFIRSEGFPICEEGPFCGDGQLDEGEQCDDGNVLSGDGCSATCEIEQVESLLLTSMCTYEEDGARWRVRNANAFDVPFTWEVYSQLETGEDVAIASSDTFFDSSLTGTMKIYWENELGEIQSTVKATNPALCPTPPPVCEEDIMALEAGCTGGDFTEDTSLYGGACRKLVCEDGGILQVLACDKEDGTYEMYRGDADGDFVEICLDGTCLNNEDLRGFQKETFCPE